MKKQFLIFNSKKELEFKILVEKNKNNKKYFLFYSYSRNWTTKVRGRMSKLIIDDGNGYKIYQGVKYYDYGEFSDLRLLISFIDNYDKNLCERYLIVDENKFKEI